MAEALDQEMAFLRFWAIFSPEGLPQTYEELTEVARNAFTNGFYAGMDYEAELQLERDVSNGHSNQRAS